MKRNPQEWLTQADYDFQPPEHIGRFLVKLDQASIATRYPEDLQKLQAVYTRPAAKEILSQTKEVLEWVKKTF